jgi:hypothetical protein
MSNYLASYLDTEKKTVMICDDEQDLRELFGKALKSKNTMLFWLILVRIVLINT